MPLISKQITGLHEKPKGRPASYPNSSEMGTLAELLLEGCVMSVETSNRTSQAPLSVLSMVTAASSNCKHVRSPLHSRQIACTASELLSTVHNLVQAVLDISELLRILHGASRVERSQELTSG